MSYVPRAGAVRDTRGFVKMVADAESAKVLGVTMVGRDAGEVIHEAAMGLRLGATIKDFAGLTVMGLPFLLFWIVGSVVLTSPIMALVGALDAKHATRADATPPARDAGHAR